MHTLSDTTNHDIRIEDGVAYLYVVTVDAVTSVGPDLSDAIGDGVYFAKLGEDPDGTAVVSTDRNYAILMACRMFGIPDPERFVCPQWAASGMPGPEDDYVAF